MGGAALALVPACLVNPYGWRGALLPFEVFPKITAWGGPYKSYVGENMDLRTFVQTVGLEGAAGDFFFRAECFLLVMLPLSFIVPAVWRLARPAGSAGALDTRRSVPWLVAFGLAAGLIAACWLGFSEAGTAAWIAQLGRLAPWCLVAAGILGAALLLVTRSSAAPPLLAASGGAAEAAWIVWLRGHLSGAEPRLYVAGIGAVLGLTATAIILRHRQRGRLFRVILSIAFGYLALIALRNINLFALVAGFVMAWNLGEWASELKSVREETAPVQWSLVLAGLIAQSGLAVLVGWWIVAIASGAFFRSTGEVRRFGLGESPLAYAHEAAKFAGGAGMPERALALDFRQAAVYLFHNGPDRKIFFDGRLEIPTRATFDTFVRLGRPSKRRESRLGRGSRAPGQPAHPARPRRGFWCRGHPLDSTWLALRLLRSGRFRVRRQSPGCARRQVPRRGFRGPPLPRPGLAGNARNTSRARGGWCLDKAGLGDWAAGPVRDGICDFHSCSWRATDCGKVSPPAPAATRARQRPRGFGTCWATALGTCRPI